MGIVLHYSIVIVMGCISVFQPVVWFHWLFTIRFYYKVNL